MATHYSLIESDKIWIVTLLTIREPMHCCLDFTKPNWQWGCDLYAKLLWFTGIYINSYNMKNDSDLYRVFQRTIARVALLGIFLVTLKGFYTIDCLMKKVAYNQFVIFIYNGSYQSIEVNIPDHADDTVWSMTDTRSRK